MPGEQAKALRLKTGWRLTASALLTGPVCPCRPLTRFAHRPKWPELAKSRHSTKAFSCQQRGRSSVGRAPQSHCGGQGFKSPRLHQLKHLLLLGNRPVPLLAAKSEISAIHVCATARDNRWLRFASARANTKSRYDAPDFCTSPRLFHILKDAQAWARQTEARVDRNEIAAPILRRRNQQVMHDTCLPGSSCC